MSTRDKPDGWYRFIEYFTYFITVHPLKIEPIYKVETKGKFSFDFPLLKLWNFKICAGRLSGMIFYPYQNIPRTVVRRYNVRISSICTYYDDIHGYYVIYYLEWLIISDLMHLYF